MKLLSGILLIVIIAWGCQPEATTDERRYLQVSGETMGTSYSVTYYSNTNTPYKDSIEGYLKEVNDAVSTYLPNSLISHFNRTGLVRVPVDREGRILRPIDWYYIANVNESFRVFQASDGAFDPTVAPLVNLWGFGWEGRAPAVPDSSVVDETLSDVGLQNIEIDRIGDTLEVRRLRDGVTLDFSAIAKGYGVDVISTFLESQGVFDYYVEIGGEIRVAGDSPRGGPWILGINVPSPDASPSEVFARVALQTMAMATSGNYRNYYFIDGKKVWHSINPKTGYPEENNLLSATVLAAHCIEADALATACMVMGVNDALSMIEAMEETEAFLIYADSTGSMATSMSSGFAKYLVEQ